MGFYWSDVVMTRAERRLRNVAVLARGYREYAVWAKWAARQPQEEPRVNVELRAVAKELRYVADQLDVVLGKGVR